MVRTGYMWRDFHRIADDSKRIPLSADNHGCHGFSAKGFLAVRALFERRRARETALTDQGHGLAFSSLPVFLIQNISLRDLRVLCRTRCAGFDSRSVDAHTRIEESQSKWTHH